MVFDIICILVIDFVLWFLGEDLFSWDLDV